MNSKILIEIVRENKTQDRNIVSKEYITDLYVLTKTDDIDTLFRKDTNSMYIVNYEDKSLIEIAENPKQIDHINQLKAIFSDISINQTISEDKNKNYLIESKNDNMSLNVKIKTQIIEELANTVSSDMYELSKKTNIFNLPLTNKEIVESSDFCINIQGNESIIETKTNSIDIVLDDVSKYDYLYNYSIV